MAFSNLSWVKYCSIAPRIVRSLTGVNTRRAISTWGYSGVIYSRCWKCCLSCFLVGKSFVQSGQLFSGQMVSISWLASLSDSSRLSIRWARHFSLSASRLFWEKSAKSKHYKRMLTLNSLKWRSKSSIFLKRAEHEHSQYIVNWVCVWVECTSPIQCEEC